MDPLVILIPGSEIIAPPNTLADSILVNRNDPPQLGQIQKVRLARSTPASLRNIQCHRPIYGKPSMSTHRPACVCSEGRGGYLFLRPCCDELDCASAPPTQRYVCRTEVWQRYFIWRGLDENSNHSYLLCMIVHGGTDRFC